MTQLSSPDGRGKQLSKTSLRIRRKLFLQERVPQGSIFAPFELPSGECGINLVLSKPRTLSHTDSIRILLGLNICRMPGAVSRAVISEQGFQEPFLEDEGPCTLNGVVFVEQLFVGGAAALPHNDLKQAQAYSKATLNPPYSDPRPTLE